MTLAETIILSAALSADALGIGASCRLKGIKTPLLSKATVSILSAVLTGAAVLFGCITENAAPAVITNTVGAALIIILGVYIIFGALNENRKQNLPDSGNNAVEKTARILTHPEYSDMNCSNRIEFKEAVYIGAAVSADSAAAGFGLGRDGWAVPVFCGLFQFIFLCIGDKIAHFAQKTNILKEIYFSIISGLILIIIGVIRLC